MHTYLFPSIISLVGTMILKLVIMSHFYPVPEHGESSSSRNFMSLTFLLTIATSVYDNDVMQEDELRLATVRTCKYCSLCVY
jgi:hypothetical protein